MMCQVKNMPFVIYRVSHNLVNKKFDFPSQFSVKSLLNYETSDKTPIRVEREHFFYGRMGANNWRMLQSIA